MTSLPLFLGMSGGEIAFVLFAALLLFGADKIPDIARELGKGIKSIRHATNDIKSEITKSSEKSSEMKEDASKGIQNSTKELKEEVTKVKEDIEKITGAIKRKF
ncbi:MAG TPA: twin-arginine translocase TatA/TatE family subunit [Flavobacteriaceae bacterium]|nr:twin-arginine translocase TatA/TatE family subunit [Flavobacteriaceae bacterium]